MDKKAYAKQRLKERTASKRFKLPEGETTFRVLPNKESEDEPEFSEYGMHSNVGPQNRYLRCGKKRSGKGDCWLCDKIAVLEESKKSSHRAAAEKMVRVEKFATQIAYVSDEKWLGPTLWEMPSSIANGLLGVMHRKNVSDLKKGYNLTVERVGTTFKGTKYGSLLVDDEPSKVPSSIVEKMKTFEELVPKYNETQQKSAYYGHEQDEDEEEEEAKKPKDEDEDEPEEEEETPKKPGKKPKDEDEDEPEEEDSEFQALEDEEEAPKPKKKPKDEDGDEDEPVEEEPEEEEVKPKKKRKKDEDEEEPEEPEEDEPEDEEDEPKPKKKDKKKPKHDEDDE